MPPVQQKTVIKPALANAQVIGDRHDLSTQAYQGGGRGIDQHMLATLRDAVLGDFARRQRSIAEVGLRGGWKLDLLKQESFIL